MFATEIYRAFARYNRWMNTRLMAACAQLTDEERKREVGAPFGSIHGLWNHILVADRLWLARFEAREMPYHALNATVCDDFETLRREREITDDAIDSLVAGLTSEKLAADFSYVSLSNPQRRTCAFWEVLTHLFNHQTHHRGQISASLEQLGGDCGVTDFLMMPGVCLLETNC